MIRGVISGYFNPLGPHHIELMKLAKQKCDYLIVIVNNDEQAIQKHGRTFMTLEERISVLQSIRYIDECIPSIDTDRSICKTLKSLKDVDMFLNGGDTSNDDIAERSVCKELNIQLVDGLGLKSNSSRWILERYVSSFSKKIINT